MPNINTSGSFVRGNSSGRFFTPAAVKDRMSSYGSIGTVKGVQMGMALTSYTGDASLGKGFQSQISKSMNEGSPSTPCLSINVPGMWRFRWVVKTGARSIYVLAKQNSTGSVNRPSLIVKSNLNVGLQNDISGSAADGNNWISIGPVSFTSTGTDVVWVELWNNNYVTYETPALFDHIVTI